MSYQTRTDPPEPIAAVCYEGQPLDGIAVERVEQDAYGSTYFHVVDEAENTARVRSGTYLVNGAWLGSEAFNALYEKVPEPEPAPEPEPIVEEPPAVEVAPSPPAEEVQVLSIAPSALHVDQGPWNPIHPPEVPVADADAPAAGEPHDVQAEAPAAPEATGEEVTTHEGE